MTIASMTPGSTASTDGKSGSQVGYNAAPFAEQTTFHGGRQSMPFLYSNTGTVTTSEATRTFSPAQDWTRGGAKTLVLYFYGDPANTGGQLYVKINGTKVSYSGANTVQTAGWGQWNIDLASTGVNLKAVKTLTLGVEGSGTGKLLFDDVLLYATAPAVRPAVWPRHQARDRDGRHGGIRSRRRHVSHKLGPGDAL